METIQKNKVSSKKKVIRSVGVFFGVLIMLIVINFIPTFFQKHPDMKEFRGDYVNVYYQNEEEAARAFFEYADTQADVLISQLGVDDAIVLDIFIYDNQSTMQTKKYGLIALVLNLDWYIGDNNKTTVYLTSPANPGNMHHYDAVLDIGMHEMVHAYNSVINPNMSLWLDEGIALYLTNGEPFARERLNHMELPTFSDIQTSNPLIFNDIGGYMLAHTYIEFIEHEFGWDVVTDLIRTEEYDRVLGMSAEDTYNMWMNYLHSGVY